MRRRLTLVGLIVLALCGLSGTSKAGPNGCTNAPNLVSMAYEQITVSSTAVGFTAATFAPAGGIPADMAQITVETNALRYRDDGLNPTAAIGFPILTNTAYTVCGLANIRTARFIRQSADGTLNVIYYRVGP